MAPDVLEKEKKRQSFLFLAISCTKIQKAMLNPEIVEHKSKARHILQSNWAVVLKLSKSRMENGELYESGNSQEKFQWVRNTIFCRCHPGLGCEIMDQLLCGFVNI